MLATYKQARAVVVAAVVTLAGLLAPPIARASNPTPENALAALNAWRAEAGIPPVAALDAELTEGCRLHNAYMAANWDPNQPHAENPSLPGYTPLGAQAGSRSNIAGWSGTHDTAPRALWSNSIEHRMPLLDPRAVTAWFDATLNRACMGTSTSADAAHRTPALAVYPWPANGTREVDAYYNPDVCPTASAQRLVPHLEGGLGYLTSISVNGPWDYITRRSLTAVSLTPDGGAPIPVTGVDQFLAIFPHKALEQGTWYTARAAGSVSGSTGSSVSTETFDITWRFKTVLANPGTSIRTDQSTLAERGRILLQTLSPAPVRVSVDRAGQQVAERMMSNGETWDTGLPAGRYGVRGHQDPTERFAGFAGIAPFDLTVRDPASFIHPTTIQITAKLSGRKVKYNTVVTSPMRRDITVEAQRRVRQCQQGKKVGKNRTSGTRRCEMKWKSFRTIVRKAKYTQVRSITVRRGDRRIRLLVSVPEARFREETYRGASLVKDLRR